MLEFNQDLVVRRLLNRFVAADSEFTIWTRVFDPCDRLGGRNGHAGFEMVAMHLRLRVSNGGGNSENGGVVGVGGTVGVPRTCPTSYHAAGQMPISFSEVATLMLLPRLL